MEDCFEVEIIRILDAFYFLKWIHNNFTRTSLIFYGKHGWNMFRYFKLKISDTKCAIIWQAFVFAIKCNYIKGSNICHFECVSICINQHLPWYLACSYVSETIDRSHYKYQNLCLEKRSDNKKQRSTHDHTVVHRILIPL